MKHFFLSDEPEIEEEKSTQTCKYRNERSIQRDSKKKVGGRWKDNLAKRFNRKSTKDGAKVGKLGGLQARRANPTS